MSIRPLNILHIIRTLAPESGGAVSYLGAVAKCGREGLQAWIVTSEGGHSPPHGIRRAYTPVEGGFGPWGLRRWLASRVHDYDVIHIHGVFSWPLYHGAAVCRSQGIPFVVSSHGHLYPWSLAQKPLRKSLYLRLMGESRLRAAAALVATTQHEADALHARLPGTRIEIIPPGVESAERLPDPHRSNEVLQVAFLGRFAPQKGLPILLQAIAVLRSRGLAVKLTLLGCGESDYERELRSMIAAHDLVPHVCFAGFLPTQERDQALRGAHVLALPSHMENFSFATAEALAQGIPVVVSRSVALSVLVERYACGQVIPDGDVPALADALQCYRDAARQRTEAEHALRCAHDALSVTRMGESLEALYRRIAAGGGHQS